MKIRLKDNKITLYDIERDYRQYLFQYDFRVNLKPNRRLYIFHTINFKAFKKRWKKKIHFPNASGKSSPLFPKAMSPLTVMWRNWQDRPAPRARWAVC